MEKKGELLAYSIWLGLSMETRQKLAQMFGFTQRTGTEVVAQRVVRDGFAHEDLWLITVEKMQAVLGTNETDFYKLFWEVVALIENEDNKPAPAAEEQEAEIKTDVQEATPEAVAAEPVEVAGPVKKTRSTKKAKAD